MKKQHQNVTLQTTYNNEMVGFNQWQLDRFTNLNYDSEVTPFEQLVSLKDRDNIQLNWILYTENIIPSTRREFLSSSTSRVGYENRFWRTLRSDRDRFTFSNSCGVYNYADITGDPDHINYISQSIFCLDAPSQFMTRTGPPVIFSQPQTGFIALGWQLYRGSSLITARYSGSAEGSTNAANPMTASVVSPAGELQNTYSFYHFNTPATSSIIPDVRPEAGSFEKKQIPLCIRNAALYSRKHMLNSPLSLNSPSGLRMIDSTFYGTEANADKTPGNGPHRLRQIPGMEGDATSGSTSASYGPGVTPNAGFGSPSWRGVVGWRVPTGSGEALWEAPSQAGYITSSVVYDPNGPFGPNVPAHRYDFVSKPSAPWYNDYDDFRQTIKTLARGYAVIPEFRISDQVENYVAVNTSQDPNNLSTFSIPGTEFNSAQDSFYKDYSNSDFLKNFLDIKRMSDLDATEIKLTCKAAIKFNPYNGFYPAQRTLQLVSQFSKSFADSVVVSAEFPLTIAQRALWTGSNPQAGPYPPTHVISGSMTYGFSYVRPLVQPFFAPGILYNSIKSGLAVDYPIVESGYNVNRIRVTGSWSDSVNPEFMCENYMLTSNTLTVSGTHKFNLGKASVQAFRNRSYVSGQFWDQRVPFEAIMDPMKYIAGTKIPDIEPHPSVRNPYSFTASMNGPRGPVYKLMASNFFAEVGRFFLKDGDYTKLKSSGVNLAGYKFQEGEVYGARLRIKTSYDGVRSYDYESSSTGNNEFYAFDGAAAYFKSRDGSAGFDYQLSGSAASTSGSFELPQDPALNPTFKKNFIMYSRTTAFGPPVSGRVWGTASGGMLTGSGTDSLIFANNRFALSASCYGVKDSMVGYNWAFTPPYYDGEAWIDFIFRPSASVSYDMETILKETQIIKRRYDPGPDMHGHRRFANDNVAGTGGNYRRTLVSDCAPDLMTGSHWTTGDSRDYPKTFAPYASDNINDNAMQLDSCLNLFGIEQIQKETRDKFGSLKEQTNESIGQRWVIQTKFETPHMNFSDTGAHPITASFPNAVGGMASGSSTLTMPTNFGSSSVPRGMWHQFGVTETSPHREFSWRWARFPPRGLKIITRL